MLGLVGAHRVGKTTLAERFAAARRGQQWKFAQTSVSAIFRDLGHDPAETFDFKTRLTIQEQILIRLTRFYRESTGQFVITDRTPIDMLAYTMSEANGEAVGPDLQARFKGYANDCFTVTNKFFSAVLVVQPGIPIIDAPGKAAPNAAYLEHLNTLMIGLCCDERMKVPHFFIPRTRLTMESRIDSVEAAKDRAYQLAIYQASEMQSKVFH